MMHELGYTRNYWYTLSWNSSMSDISGSMTPKKQKSRKGATRVENVNGGVAKAEEKVKGVAEEVHYRGVRKRPSGKYMAATRDPRKICNVLFGTFDTTEEGGQEYDMIAIEFRGVKVKMNLLNLMDEMNRTPNQVSIVESLKVVAVVAIQPLPLPLPPPQPPP
ncbi:Ethylene-responsive transcription factor 4 [Capsicum baccatum]|uniref:Ethylene-responsive transcription factor 4 n=1 Tax=Capsicum baccatum TaxID=33114 RepID=A0A2G2VB72_CAPBA|nr:Ethylene-responsive transcription factor 4 [Capsicum baccatum]